MKILFWNLKGNGVTDLVRQCLEEHRVDAAVFAEHGGLDRRRLERESGGAYRFVEGILGQKRIALAVSRESDAMVRQEENRYSLYTVWCGGVSYVLAGVHLHDRWHYPDPTPRLAAIRTLIPDVYNLEQETDCHRIVIIGDLNANPYDRELLQADAFNAVLFKDVIRSNEICVKDKIRYRRLYNPILHFLSEDLRNYGSFYRDKEFYTPVWHCLDQVLVNKALMDDVRELRYLRQIGDTSLMKRTRPDTSISDHLPLLVHLEGGEDI